MAETVVPDLTLIDNADTATGWDGTSGGIDNEVFLQGTGSWTYQTPKNGVGNGNFTPLAAINISGTDNHIYWWMQCAVFPFCEEKNTGTVLPSGLMLRLTDGTGNDITWHIAGSNTWGGEWKCFVQDLNDITSTQVYAKTGVIDLTDIVLLEWLTDNSNSGTIRIIDNTWIDVVRYGTGLTAKGPTFDFQAIEAADQASANMYGVVKKIDGVYFIQGRIIIGDGTTTSFTSENETIAFRDNYVSAGLYGIKFTGAATTVDISTMSILSSGLNANTRPGFLVDPTVTGFTMDGSSINRGDFVELNDACIVSNSVFNNCNTVSPELCDFESNTISNSNHTRALEVHNNATTGITSCNFLSNTNAMWYASGSTYTDYSNNFDGNTYDIENSSAAALTINLDGTSNVSTYVNTGGGSTSLVSTTNFTLTGLKSSPATEIRIYDSTLTTELAGQEDVTSGTFTYQYGISEQQNGVIVQIHNIQYETIRLTVDWDGTDASIPIQQQYDRNYSNP